MDPEQFDWDTWQAQVDEVARNMRGVSERMTRQIAESRAARASYGEQRASESVVRESPPPTGDLPMPDRIDRVEGRLNQIDARLGGVEQMLVEMRGDLKDIRERMATKVELESLTHDIHMVADGVAQTQGRLSEVKGLLLRYLTNA